MNGPPELHQPPQSQTLARNRLRVHEADLWPASLSVTHLRIARELTVMRRSADLICGEEWPSDGQTSYAYGQRKGREQTLGCQQDHGILSDVVIPAFPQLCGVQPWLPCCRPRDWRHAV